MHDLSPEELRVLGCLLEKQRTTPDTYPLSLNALRAACNQSTNREPVVAYDESTIRDALERLRRRGFTRLTSYHGSRTAKYRHLLDDALQISPEEQSLLAVMMLRGPQTPGELLQRTERLFHFPDSAALHAVLDRLLERELATRYDRRPGQREERYGHLLGDEAEAPAPVVAAAPPPPPPPAPPPGHDRLDRLEREVAELRAEVAALREELGRVKFEQRKRWRNHTGNQWVEPLRIYRPATLAELQEIVRTAEADKATARAVGSGHSWSDVALTTGYLLRTDRLGDPLPLDCVRRDHGDETLVRVEAGMRIRALNQHLADQDLALSQMGGYDAQTVAGVVSTSTHGSGLEFGPLNDFVRSFDLVAAGGRVHRIEPAHGPTDPAAFARAHPDWVLHQDDDTFDAAAVNMGCMGVIYAATLAVEGAYWLTEVRELSTWSKVRGQIPAALQANRHYELYLNLYPGDDGEHRCIVCRRNRTRDPRRRRRTDRLRRHWWIELASRSKVIPFVGNLALDLMPDSAPRRTDQLLGALADNEYTGASYKVLNIGAANLLPAYSSELAVPLADDKYLRAIDALIGVAARHRDLGAVYHTGLVAMRFVRASPAYLSMMHGGDTMMIELIQATETEGGYELLGAYEEALYELDGRPHWGQVNTLTGSHDTLARMYPEYGRWLKVHDELNASGVFDSPFAKRVGITRR